MNGVVVKHGVLMIRSLVLVPLLWLAGPTPGTADCLFVNTNSSPNLVAAFEVGPDGSLTPAAGSPFSTGGSGGFRAHVGSIGLCPASSRLYVSNSASDDVSGFRVALDCTLTPLPGSPYGAGLTPVGIDLDPAGDFLYVSNFVGNNISAYEIADDGSLAQIPGSPFGSPITPLDIQFAPAGDQFFVSHDFDHSVGAYDQASDGTFTSLPGSPFPAGGIEHGLVVNPSGSRLYVADLRTHTITGFSVGSGGLTSLAQSPYSTGAAPIELVVDFADRFLYVTHRNGDTIGGFAIDGQGNLTRLPDSPFPSDSRGPAGLAQDPRGRYLFVANGGFDGHPDVSVYAVSATGSLTPIPGSPFPTGGTGHATGIAYLRQLSNPVAIPTLGEAGLWALVLALLGLGVAWLRHR